MSGIVCISGYDSSGGAGIDADKRACAHLKIKCHAVIATQTEQSNDGVSSVKPVSPELIMSGIETALEQDPKAVKIGLINSPASIMTVNEALSEITGSIPIIIDPVLSSSSGFELVSPDFILEFKEKLLPLATLITPNIPEAEKLTGLVINNLKQIEEASQILHELGADYVLIKGGHLVSSESTDILYDGSKFRQLSGERISGKFRGTGCTLSTLTAGYLSLGHDMPESVQRAKTDIQKAIMGASEQGKITLFSNGVID